jgi:NADPH-dependent 7-cyano-7-deazaguanine reductase QueF-like protein
MNLPTEFQGRPITACWVFNVRVNTQSKKRTAWTLYEVSALNEKGAIYEAKQRAKSRDIISIDSPTLIGLGFAYYADNELEWLTSNEKNILLSIALQNNKTIQQSSNLNTH